MQSQKSFLSFLNSKAQGVKGTYIAVKVKNKAELYDWFDVQGIPNLEDEQELHCTIAYSRTAIKGYIPSKDVITINPEQLISIEPLGDKGAIVLKYTSDELQQRFDKAISLGGTFDYEQYTPHITISYNIGDINTKDIVLPTFPIELCCEYVEDLNLDL